MFNNSPGNVIAGNWIGSSATGSPLGNQGDGIIIDGSSNNTVGGTAASWQPDRVERDQRRHDQQRHRKRHPRECDRQ